MSDTTTAAAASPDDVLFSSVYAPVFIKECQAHGIPVDANDSEQVGEMLKIAYALRVRAEAEATKQANAARNVIKQASAALQADTFGAPRPQERRIDVSGFMANEAIAKAAAAVAGA
jgi:hypothetical protein